MMKNPLYASLALVLTFALTACGDRSRLDERTKTPRASDDQNVPAEDQRQAPQTIEPVTPEAPVDPADDEKIAEELAKKIFDRAQAPDESDGNTNTAGRPSPEETTMPPANDEPEVYVCAPCAGVNETYRDLANAEKNCAILKQNLCPASSGSTATSPAGTNSGSTTTGSNTVLPVLSADLKSAIEAVVRNTERKGLTIYNMSWNVAGTGERSFFSRNSNSVKAPLNGILELRMAYVKGTSLDDQFIFAIELKDNVVVSMKATQKYLLSSSTLDTASLKSTSLLKPGVTLNSSKILEMVKRIDSHKPASPSEASTFIGARISLEIIRGYL